jgi:hypothetical protein
MSHREIISATLDRDQQVLAFGLDGGDTAAISLGALVHTLGSAMADEIADTEPDDTDDADDVEEAA